MEEGELVFRDGAMPSDPVAAGGGRICGLVNLRSIEQFEIQKLAGEGIPPATP